jgi:hypothetical protein
MTSNIERKYNVVFLDITIDDENHFAIRIDENGNSGIVFGNGKRGSLSPSGMENIKEVYRKGIGTTGEVNDDHIELEDGIEIKFVDVVYRTGDYWVFPARTTKGETESSYDAIYLDVWGRDISALDDESIKDSALGGVDTTIRDTKGNYLQGNTQSDSNSNDHDSKRKKKSL